MKIAFLAGYNSIHTVRWVNSLSERGNDVYLFTLHRKGDVLDSRVKKIILPILPPAGYYLNLPFIRYHLRKIQPDILNAHYASGYGTLGRLSGFSPYILSVWGSDVYDFPHSSESNHKLIVKNILSAQMVCSTSHAMAKVTKTLCPDLTAIHVTPFGVDTEIFYPDVSFKDKSTFTVGTVKNLKEKYGIDILIRSFAKTRRKVNKINPELAQKMRLLIVGEGTIKEDLIQLAAEEGISKITDFKGSVPYDRVPEFLNKMNIFAAFSRSDSESFGVAIVEASSCGIPVAVSDADGPSEVVVNNKTGLIVPREDVEASSEALFRLIQDFSFRKKLGDAGRSHVINNFSWDKSLDTMVNIYKLVLDSKTKQH